MWCIYNSDVKIPHLVYAGKGSLLGLFLELEVNSVIHPHRWFRVISSCKIFSVVPNVI